MSASGSPLYSTLVPNNSDRAMAPTDGCTLRSSTASSHQHEVSARANSGSRFCMSYRRAADCTAAAFFDPSSSLSSLARPPLPWLPSSSSLSSPSSSSSSSVGAFDVSACFVLVSKPSPPPISSSSSSTSTKRSTSSASSPSRGCRMASQCDGLSLRNSLTNIRAPHANGAGACAATCSRRFTTAAALLGCGSSLSALNVSENSCPAAADEPRGTPGCSSAPYSAR
mmetsp:Transcript_14575/g.23998  ORF Transcript_14575/g.23998 Transcript_14575/m.23998 type:complete len:226 (+) Transcript_14575:767-1444(+)